MTFEDAWPCRLLGRAGRATFDVKSEGEGEGDERLLGVGGQGREGLGDKLCCNSLSL